MKSRQKNGRDSRSRETEVGEKIAVTTLEQQIFNFPFSPSHSSGVTKPSSLKLATSGITHPSDAQKGESQVI